MNKIEKSENNNTQNMSSFKIEDIRRCFYCNKIPLIELIEKSYEFFIKYNCEIGHQGEVNLEEYLKNDKYSLKKLKCDECNKKQKNDFYLYNYCITCKKVLCHNCLKFHLEKEHQTNNFSRYDSICLKHNHNHNYNNYCNNCKKNICMLCLNEHKGHQIDSLSKYLDSENINNFDNKKNEVINIIEKIKKEIMEEYSNVIKYLDAYLNYINKNMIFSLINNLIDTYNFEKKLNNYNYEISENLKNIEKIKFEYPDFSNCKNIFEKWQTFVSFYNNNKEIINENKKFNIKNSKIYKTLDKHKDTVNQIILLKDGRIASSSNDQSILIYNKEMDNVELTINLESNVLNIMQSNDGYIFASLDSGSISIFKLNTLNSSQLIESVEEHKKLVSKIIQIKDGRFISCSYDKTIKIWNFLNEKLTLNKSLDEDNEISSIMEYKENEIISTPYGEGSIIFWNVNESKIIEQINKTKSNKQIKCNWDWNIIEKINENTVIVGGKHFIYLIKNYKLVIDIDMNSYCYCLCYLSYGNILTGHDNGTIKEWEFRNNELKCIGEKKVHDKLISVIYEIKNNFLLSGSQDKKINIYKLEDS